MARKYSKAAGRKVERAMEEMKEGKLRSGRSGKKVTNRKQAIAIGLSEARAEGKKVPRKKAARRSARTRQAQVELAQRTRRRACGRRIAAPRRLTCSAVFCGPALGRPL